MGQSSSGQVILKMNNLRHGRLPYKWPMAMHLVLSLLTSTCRAMSWSPPQSTLQMIDIASANGMAQRLPTSLVKWPLWIVHENGKAVTQVPGSGQAEADGAPQSWVDPVSFEHLWLPEDLEAPQLHLSLGLVLKDGEPRYLFPCAEASLEQQQLVWHNRGLCSVPLGNTWLPWGVVPMPSLRLSAFSREMTVAVDDGEGEEVVEVKAAPQQEELPWETLRESLPVGGSLSSMWKVLADAPPELSDGYHFMMARLGDVTVPTSIIRPGRQLRLLLTDNLLSPDLNDPNWQLEVGAYGGCDVSMYAVPPGRQSEYMPEVTRSQPPQLYSGVRLTCAAH